jgi:hypothetical protein
VGACACHGKDIEVVVSPFQALSQGIAGEWADCGEKITVGNILHLMAAQDSHWEHARSIHDLHRRIGAKPADSFSVMFFLPVLGVLVSGSQHLLELFDCTHCFCSFLSGLPRIEAMSDTQLSGPDTPLLINQIKSSFIAEKALPYYLIKH